MLRLHVLGPLHATLDGHPLDLGTSRQRAVIARLAAAGGQVISTDRFIDDLWQGQPPPKALAALQVYISNLRRALEPDRPPRAPAQVIVSAPPGYRLALPQDAVDAWRFPNLIEAAGEALKHADPATTHRLLDEALGLWKGPAYAEYEWAAPESARLAELRLLAVEYRAEAALMAGGHAEAVPELRGHVREHPLRENAVRLLALAHYRAGSQAEALAVLRRARNRLRDELGVDPGPALKALEQEILRQDESLQVPAVVEPARRPKQEPQGLVGRARELARLREEAEQHGHRTVWLGGEPGSGKTTLAEAFAAASTRRVAFGRCPEIDGDAPPAWAWSEIVRQLGAKDERLRPLTEDGVPIASQFLLARALADYLAGLGPLLLVVEDVHRADSETLHLLRHLTSADVLVIATYRPDEAGDDLFATMAALASVSAHLRLDGLEEHEVATVLARISEREVDADLVRTVTERTAGNPLFVSEVARLIAGDGPEAAQKLPLGVRDVIRRRIARLPASARTVLRNAAIVGRDADVEVLLHLQDEDAVLDGLEAGVLTGLLTEPRPGQVRFTHVLVRQALYEETARIRRTRLHGKVLTALQQVRPADVAALAHHALESASPEAVRYASAAAVQASGLYAHREAAALWEAALEFAQDDDTRLDLLCGLVSARAHAGDVVGALQARARAVQLGLRTGQAARALTSYDAPVTWTLQENGALDPAFVAAVERELAAEHDDVTRCRLLAALVFALESHDDERVDEAGLEAVALARRLGRPDLLCLALNARYFSVVGPWRRDELAALGHELLELGETHRLVGYLMQGHHALFMVALGGNDLETAQRHADRAVELSATGQLGLALAVLGLFGAVRRLLEGDFDAAEATYAEMARLMGERGGVNAAWIGVLGRFFVKQARGTAGDLVPELRALFELAARSGPPNEGVHEVYAGALAAAGDLDAARAVWRPHMPHPRNYYWLLWETQRAITAVALGDTEVAARCYEELLPWSGQLAGLHSGSITLGPVALVLGDLAVRLGLPSKDHYDRAAKVAESVGSGHWADEARRRSAAAASGVRG
ncbi:BTAD domain-containing putative transcriptional regulator [Nonomuraea sp. NPDC050556]|uniref:BTAD domain-containing putative transcriptional regulator n=1 Tax=Nonomuraea sp. NPDC050556 TaxID=3364369 RepID=UPI0037B63DA5